MDVSKLSINEMSELIWQANAHLYRERPVTIQEFLDSPQFIQPIYPNIYPIWRETLYELFPSPFTSPYNEVVISASAGCGKGELPTEHVVTPNGWKQIGSLKIGDEVCGTDGKVYHVRGIYPQGKRPTFKVCFSDYTEVICDDQHLWTVQTAQNREKATPSKGGKIEYTTLSTLEMLDDVKVGKAKRLNYSIDYIDPVYFNPKPILMDPYLLGLLLGDGCFRGNSIGFSNTEKDIITKCEKLMTSYGAKLYAKSHKDFKINNSRLLKDCLKSLGLLNCYSWEKFIPKNYIYNSIDVRLAVLRGLIDTDGFVSNGTHNHKNSGTSIEFSTTSIQLRDDVIEIVRSLGGRATYIERTGRYKKDEKIIETRTNYRVLISFFNGIVPYSSEKHLKKYKPQYLRPMKKYITSIIPNGEEETICIEVDSPNHLYITEGYNMTHNTTSATIGMLYNIYKCGCLKQPASYFGLAPNTKLIFAVFSANLALSGDVNWGDLTTAIKEMEWFKGKIVDEKGLDKKNGSLVAVEVLPQIYIQMGSRFGHGMGKALMEVLIDEAAFQQEKSGQAEKTYNETSSRMFTRFAEYSKSGELPGHLWLISSPKDATDFLQQQIDAAKESGSSKVLIKDNIAAWHAKPELMKDEKFMMFIGNEFKEPHIVEDNEEISDDELDYIIYPPVRFYDAFKRNPIANIMNLGGIRTVSAASLFQSQTILADSMMATNPFTMDSIPLPFDMNASQIMDFMDKEYFKDIRHPEANRFIHLDAAFSSDTIDRFGIASCYCVLRDKTIYANLEHRMKLEPDIFEKAEKQFFVDFAIGIEPLPNQKVPFKKIEDFIFYLIKKMQYPVACISADTFQSQRTLQEFENAKLPTENVSVDRKKDPYWFFRDCVYDRDIVMPNNAVLKHELKKLREDTKKIDHPCLTGDTRIRLLDGTTPTIEELASRGADKQFWVYSCKSDGTVVPALATNAIKTKTVNKIVRVTLDNGKSFECTTDHLVMLRNGEYLEAEKLTVGESLMPLRTSKYGNYEILWDNKTNTRQATHRMVYKYFNGDYDNNKDVIHHYDLNPRNNCPENLKRLSKEEHARVHAYLSKLGKQQIEKRITTFKQNYRKKVGLPIDSVLTLHQIKKEQNKKFKTRLEFEQFRNQWCEQISKLAKTKLASSNNIKYQNTQGYWASTEGRKRRTELSKTQLRDASKIAYENAYKKRKKIFDNIPKPIDISYALSYNHLAKRLNLPIGTGAKLLKEHLTIDFKSKLIKELTGKTKNEIANLCGIAKAQVAPQLRHYNLEYLIKDETFNHKIKQIEYIEKTEDVFDITVPEFHNFAIDCGIFVHNCNGTKDIADAVCGALWNCKRSKNIINIAKLSSVILNPNENAAYSKLSEEEKQALEFAEFERARTQMSNTILRKL